LVYGRIKLHLNVVNAIAQSEMNSARISNSNKGSRKLFLVANERGGMNLANPARLSYFVVAILSPFFPQSILSEAKNLKLSKFKAIDSSLRFPACLRRTLRRAGLPARPVEDWTR
jgi:hypothetical protein